MTEERPLPKAWKGNEHIVLLLLQARLLTLPDDLHKHELVGLWVRCWSVRTFPSSDDIRRSAYEILHCISLQLELPGRADPDSESRLRKVAGTVRTAAVTSASRPAA